MTEFLPVWLFGRAQVTVHAQERLLEHYGLRAAPIDWEAAVQQIFDGKALVLARLDCPKTTGEHTLRCVVTLAGRSIPLAWHVEQRFVITVLPTTRGRAVADARGRKGIPRYRSPKRRPGRYDRYADTGYDVD